MAEEKAKNLTTGRRQEHARSSGELWREAKEDWIAGRIANKVGR